MRKPTILIVEDEPVDARGISRILSHLPFALSVQSCESGGEALDYLLGRGQFEGEALPDLVLLDLNMPGFDGFQILDILKSDPRRRGIPVLVFTSSDNELDIIKSYERGANSYFVKPTIAEDMQEMLEKICDYWFRLARMPATHARGK